MKAINPNAPDEYKYETDYRKIPSEYLNPRIPKGRGKVKWAPFKTMPEQYEKLEQYMEDQNKIDMPLLSQEQLEDINDKVNTKIRKKTITEISYWKNGYIFSIQCYINKVDELNGLMLVTNENGKDRLQIQLSSIVNVD